MFSSSICTTSVDRDTGINAGTYKADWRDALMNQRLRRSIVGALVS